MADIIRSHRDLVPTSQGHTPPIAPNDKGVVNTYLEENIVRILDNRNIPFLDRKKLVKDNIKALISLQHTHIQHTKALDEVETTLRHDVAKRVLEGNYSQTILSLQESFIELFESLGTKVAKDQFRFMRDFAVLITACKKEIHEAGNIEESMKEAIILRLDAQLKRTLEKLDYVVDDLLGKIEESKTNV